MNRRLAAPLGAVVAATLVAAAGGAPARRAASPVELRAVLAMVAPVSVATTTAAPGGRAGAEAVVASCDVTAVQQLPAVPTSAWRAAKPSDCVVYPDARAGSTTPRYYLGPARVTTAGVRTATAELVPGQGWTVRLRLTSAGSRAWDRLAEQQFHRQVAVAASGKVVAAPTIQPNEAEFGSFGGVAVISGAFSRAQARALARLAASDHER